MTARFNSRRGRVYAPLGLLFSFLSVGLGQAPDQTSPATNTEHFIQRYGTDHSSVSRFYDLPWSPARFDRLERLHQEWKGRLEGLDFDPLDQQGRIDYLLLRNELQGELQRVALDRKRLSQMEELLPFRTALQDLEQARWHRGPLDPQAAASTVAKFPDQIKKLRKRIERGRKDEKKEEKKTEASDKTAPAESKEKKEPDEGLPLKVSPLLAKRTAAVVNALRDTLKNWFNFYDGYQPDFSWWLKKPYDDAASALEDYAKFLREEIAGIKGKDEDPLLGEPVGADRLAQELANEMIPYSPEELIAIGEKELGWCETHMKEVAQEMGLGDDWKAALARVKAQFVPPGKQEELVTEHANSALRFVREHDLVTVPPLCEETWRLTMISPEGQKTMPYAAYGGQNMMVAYARNDMKHEDKLMSMRGNNAPFTRIVTAHELIPGHHLQLFVAARNRPYRAMFSTPFLVEGWGLYWEMRLWDLKYGQRPEDKVGMLFWRMTRSARIIVSLKFHLGKMAPPEMVDFLVERVGHERFGATSEVRRFIEGDYAPLYQCAYMIGGQQLRALHQELVGSGKMSERQFHDTVLTYQAIPVELIRAGMLNLPLQRDTRANWKFAGENPR